VKPPCTPESIDTDTLVTSTILDSATKKFAFYLNDIHTPTCKSKNMTFWSASPASASPGANIMLVFLWKSHYTLFHILIIYFNSKDFRFRNYYFQFKIFRLGFTNSLHDLLRETWLQIWECQLRRQRRRLCISPVWSRAPGFLLKNCPEIPTMTTLIEYYSAFNFNLEF
jgi:hypothetical protein